eukprot:COSAG06_NODE_14681_length_1135_cov_4.827220_1_plen_35_part_10
MKEGQVHIGTKTHLFSSIVLDRLKETLPYDPDRLE